MPAHRSATEDGVVASNPAVGKSLLLGRLCLLVLLLCFFNARGEIRVALLNAICDDNSYRSTVGALDFTAALQAVAPEGFEWVERTELAKAEAEFKLTSLGLIDRAEAIQTARWTKADWGVVVRISTNRMNGRTLELEIIDLDHADLLTTTHLVLNDGGATHFKAASADVGVVAAALRQQLKVATRVRNEASSGSTVAVLFFDSIGPGGETTQLRAALEGALIGARDTNRSLHLVRFQRAEAAMDEAELVMGGLSTADLNSWQRVADWYLWGSCSVRLVPVSGRIKTQTTISLNAWNGTGDPHVVTVSVADGTREDGLAQAAARLAPLLATPPATRESADARQKIADALVTHASELARRSRILWLGEPAARERWWNLVTILETACFLDPTDARAREMWLRTRWTRDAFLLSKNEFFFARRRSEAWRKHVEYFGFSNAPTTTPLTGVGTGDSVATEFVMSAWRPLEMLSFSQYNQAAWGVPLDAGAAELTAWQDSFREEFFARLLSAPDTTNILAMSWEFFYRTLAAPPEALSPRVARLRFLLLQKLLPRVIELQRLRPIEFDGRYHKNLKQYFESRGEPGGEQSFLNQLQEIRQAHLEKLRTQPVRLPRAADLKFNESKPTEKP